MKRKSVANKYEQHYYKEVRKRIFPIEDEREQRKIDAYIKKHATTPARTACESGYSAYLFRGRDVEVNTSMVKRRKIDKTHHLISRAPKAPTLPVSCLASTEHVIAMQDEVTDFKSELEPKTKQNVMFLIQLSSTAQKDTASTTKKAILKLIHKYDTTLTQDNLNMSYNKEKDVFEMRVSTQVADIQLLVQALTSQKKYKIVDCNFEDIDLNQGVCLIKRDASNPIHALVNIANSESEKGFLERDAGTTTGVNTATYQDRNWTFNFFSSLPDMRQKTEYPEDAFAIKIVNGA